jgi:thiol-disulfide isomerase/thioredoxin
LTDPKPYARPRLTARRVLVLAAISAAVALVLTLIISNVAPPEATECPVQAEKAEALETAATGELAAVMGTGTGRSHADMAFTDEAGKQVTIADFAGKKLLVNFWASWCGPCRAEMPALDAVADKYNGETFEVLPLNTGETQPEKAKEFLAEGQFKHLPLYADTGFKLLEKLKTSAISAGLPATILLDENSCELAVLQGPAEWDTPDGHKLIEALIGI